MRAVNRSLVAVVACASLVASSLAAPMMHVHDDADHISDHHNGRVIHSHRQLHGEARHTSHETVLENLGDSEEARPIDLFQMVVGWSQPAVGLPPAIVSPPAPVLRAVTVRLLVQHSHDPPLARTRPSRAPPAVLS
jgi:hypothetical protein